MIKDSGSGGTSSSAGEDEARASMSSCPQKHYVQFALRESLWQNLYKWSPYDMDISQMRDGMRKRFLEGKRHWNGRLQNIASCNEGYCDVFPYKTEKEEILTTQ
ncbi:hypothetical protein D5086_033384 [Populus alba]|uniref:Uncharacterized protein n=1 Tax=Populus alba TaxID=43335 RepID=A0ACC4AHL3_POPAL